MFTPERKVYINNILGDEPRSMEVSHACYTLIMEIEKDFAVKGLTAPWLLQELIAEKKDKIKYKEVAIGDSIRLPPHDVKTVVEFLSTLD